MFRVTDLQRRGIGVYGHADLLGFQLIIIYQTWGNVYSTCIEAGMVDMPSGCLACFSKDAICAGRGPFGGLCDISCISWKSVRIRHARPAHADVSFYFLVIGCWS